MDGAMGLKEIKQEQKDAKRLENQAPPFFERAGLCVSRAPRSRSLLTPFPRSYWVMPGRLLVGYYPGAPDPVEAAGKLQALFDL